MAAACTTAALAPTGRSSSIAWTLSMARRGAVRGAGLRWHDRPHPDRDSMGAGRGDVALAGQAVGGKPPDPFFNHIPKALLWVSDSVVNGL
jgi:hypothetical protein